METQRKGNCAEDLARQWLENQGLKYVESNYSAKTGEIDLIMQQSSILVFIEVRYRERSNQHSSFGGAVASVDLRKQRKLIQTAQRYLQQRRLGGLNARIDVLDISGSLSEPVFDWVRNAISDCG